MATIQVEGVKYGVAENLGFSHDVGMYAKVVYTPTGEKMAVRHRGSRLWRFWSAADRVRPLREAMKQAQRMER